MDLACQVKIAFEDDVDTSSIVFVLEEFEELHPATIMFGSLEPVTIEIACSYLLHVKCAIRYLTIATVTTMETRLPTHTAMDDTEVGDEGWILVMRRRRAPKLALHVS